MVDEKNGYLVVREIFDNFEKMLSTMNKVCAKNPKFLGDLEEHHKLLSNIINKLDELEKNLREQTKSPKNFNKTP